MKETYASVALIPARSKSKRIKDKNIIDVDGHPLLAYAINSALKSEIFDQVVCVTDSERYADIATYYGAQVPSLRPEITSTDTSPDIEWVSWILGTLIKTGQNYDFFSILRPTSPFRSSATIKRANKIFLESQADSIRAVEITKQHPGKMWNLEGKYLVPLISQEINNVPWHSSQFASLPKIYSQNASLEMSWTKNVINEESISGQRIAPFFTENLEGFDINNEEDLILLEHYIKSDISQLESIDKKSYKA